VTAGGYEQMRVWNRGGGECEATLEQAPFVLLALSPLTDGSNLLNG